jgi:DNA-binding NarL/FixJ family response regulator
VRDSAKQVILVVDDDPLVLRAVQRALTTADTEVVTCHRSFGLLNRIASLAPAVVVLDVRMPGIDGDTLVQLVRTDKALEATRMVLYSGVDSATLAATAATCKADAWVTKGEGTRVLSAAVSKQLAVARKRRDGLPEPVASSPFTSGLFAATRPR